MNIFILIIFTIFIVWLINRWRTRAYVRLAFQVPSNRLHTWLGFGPILRREDVQAYILEYAKKYGSESVFWTGPFSFFLTSKPESIEQILTAKNCINKPPIVYGGLETILGAGIDTIPDPFWSHRRKIFNRAFSNLSLVSFSGIFCKEIINTIHSIEQKLKSAEDIDLHLLLKALTIRTSVKTMLKRDFESSGYVDTELAQQFARVLTYAAEISANLIMKIKFLRYLADCTIYGKATQAYECAEHLFRESLIHSRNEDSSSSNIISPVDIGLAAEKENLLSRNELEADIRHLYAASFETSSTTLFLVICMLAMHPECQERVYEEITNLLIDFNDNDKITFDQINQLSYLDMIVNETMRVLPIAPLLFRTVTNESLKLSTGHVLPVGQMVCIDIYRLHRNKEIWGPEADRFNPENFSPTNVKQRHPYAFIPFSKGPRNCIGFRYALFFLKISLIELTKKFKFKTDFKYDDLKIENRITLHLVEKPKINIELRIPKRVQLKKLK